MRRPAGLGEIATGWIHLPDHHRFSCPKANYRADRIPIARRSRESKLNVVLLRKLVREEVGSIIEVVGHDVQAAIAVEIGDHCAARASRGWLTTDVLFLIDTADRRLDPKRGTALAKRAAAVVHHQLVGPVVKRIAHS